MENNILPKIGLGTYQLKPKVTKKVVLDALDIGYRLIDTAQMYHNEKDIGEALKENIVPRNEIIIATKVWSTRLSYSKVLSSTEESLKKLQIDSIDILYIHWPTLTYKPEKTLAAFDKLIDEGKIKHIGVSNFPSSHLEQAIKIAKHPIFVNQVEHHLLLRQDILRNFMVKNNIQMVAYSPLARGRVLDITLVKDLAQKYKKSETQIALAWIIEHSVIPIPKSSSRNHLLENFNSQFIQLEREDVLKLNQLSIQKRLFSPPILAPKWDE